MSYEKYGLTATDAKGSDHSKGIVAGPDGKFYQIDGFKSEGEDEGGIDKNAGKVFSSSLESDAGVDYTNFNTPQDVENALRKLGGGGDDDGPAWDDAKHDYDLSPELVEAKERAKSWKDSQGMTIGESAPYGYGDGSGARVGQVDYDDQQDKAAIKPTDSAAQTHLEKFKASMNK